MNIIVSRLGCSQTRSQAYTLNCFTDS